MSARVIIIDAVCLTPAHLQDRMHTPNLNLLAHLGQAAVIKPVFPAVAAPVHATIATGLYPEEHGVVSDGYFDREEHEIRYGQSGGGMVRLPRFWEAWRSEGIKTALLFMRENKHCPADIILQAAPRYVAGRALPWCYSRPAELYPALVRTLGHFPQPPFRSRAAVQMACRWIGHAAEQVLKSYQPDITFVCLPVLEYDFQRYGPESIQARRALQQLDDLIGTFLRRASAAGLMEETTVLVIADYAYVPVSRPVYINRYLRQRKLLKVTRIHSREYLDMENSLAFAVADHQVAHVYCQPEAVSQVQEALAELPGVSRVLAGQEGAKLRVAHPHAGDVIAVAEANSWFVHYWWTYPRSAPAFAYNIGMHRQAPIDMVELLRDMDGCLLTTDMNRIRGSHGAPAAGNEDGVVLLAAGPGAAVVKRDAVYSHADIAEIVRLILGR